MKVEYSNRAVADLRKISADSRRAFGDRVAKALEMRISWLSRPVRTSSLTRSPQCFVCADKLVVERDKLGVEGAGKPKIAGVVK